MANDFEFEQAIVEHLTCANVVRDEVSAAIIGLLVGDNADVCDATAQVPTNNFAGFVIIGHLRDGESGSFAGEEDHEIGHPAMIDVAIGAR